MSSLSHLDTIVALQRALSDLDDARERLAGVPDWMRALHEQHAGQRAEIATFEEAIEEAGRARRTAEGAIEDEQQKLKRYQTQLNSVQTQREYGALLQEIDTAKRRITELEEEGLGALEQREQATQELAARQESFRELDERYGTELAKWEAEKPQVEDEIRHLERRIGELKNQLPRPILALFDRIYSHHGGDALAPIKSVERPGASPAVWHCGICNYRVRPQVVELVRNQRSLIQCDGCKRIFFVEEQPEEVEA